VQDEQAFASWAAFWTLCWDEGAILFVNDFTDEEQE